MPPNDNSKDTDFARNVKKKDALWHCYRLGVVNKVTKRLERAGIPFIIEQTKDREAGTKGSGYAVKVWIIHVPNLSQDKLAKILRGEKR